MVAQFMADETPSDLFIALRSMLPNPNPRPLGFLSHNGDVVDLPNPIVNKLIAEVRRIGQASRRV